MIFIAAGICGDAGRFHWVTNEQGNNIPTWTKDSLWLAAMATTDRERLMHLLRYRQEQETKA